MALHLLEVVLVEAGELKERDCWCGIDCLLPFLNKSKAPYAKIHYGTQHHFSCFARGIGKKEVWNEKFRFEAELEDKHEIKDDMKNKLVLSIIHRHQFLPDFHVGEATIYIKDVILRGMEKGKVVHGPHKYRVVRPDKSYSGEISVAVTFIKGTEGQEGDSGGMEQPNFYNKETCDS
ncbi:16 kDa phloem protein 2-like [Heracleum sosnowskyi]|uniref:16 kDa phloem protein 2-like n=1 Tax=Heracleum sosnowskyi TaxID=360622 RepID=A0AAD8HDB2_9APIA|nr:16 kDa phloem protein 2-like [Heracleum sosnowskyi]